MDTAYEWGHKSVNTFYALSAEEKASMIAYLRVKRTMESYEMHLQALDIEKQQRANDVK